MPPESADQQVDLHYLVGMVVTQWFFKHGVVGRCIVTERIQKFANAARLVRISEDLDSKEEIQI